MLGARGNLFLTSRDENLVLNIKGCESCVSSDMSLLILGKQSLNFYFIFPTAAWLKPLSIVGLAMALREQ